MRSRVPGTFKSRPPLPRRDLGPAGAQGERLLLAMGALHAERYVIGDCTVMLSREPGVGFDGGYGWHLSIAHPNRYPTWDEIKAARYGIPALDQVTMAQILGPVEDGEWVNVHDNCFHLYEIGAGDGSRPSSPVAPDGPGQDPTEGRSDEGDGGWDSPATRKRPGAEATSESVVPPSPEPSPAMSSSKTADSGDPGSAATGRADHPCGLPLTNGGNQ